MGVVILFRVALYYAPRGTVWVGTAAGSGGASQAAIGEIQRRLANDPQESDSSLSDAASAFSGTVVSVATFTGAFELRKVHLIWSQVDYTVASDDSRIATFHLAKIAGGSVSADWVAADFTLLQNKFVDFWQAIMDRYHSGTVLDRLKVYKDGPAIVPPQVPVYDADLNIAGISGSSPLPPQCAVSVTEIAGSKRNWGRFYLPAPHASASNLWGRLSGGDQTDFADATDVLYEALKAGALHPVVYRPALPERQKKNLATLPARAASAMDVEQIQVDDIFDVIRSRRWKTPKLRTQRAIA